MKKLIPKSHFHRRRTSPDSLKERIRLSGTDKINIELLSRCEQAWMNLSNFRATRLRNLRYVFGDQWGDYVKDDNGNMVKERDRIYKRTGGVVLQNNNLIKIVNTLSGLYAKTSTMPVCFARQKGADQKSEMMTNALQTNWERNEMKDLLLSEMCEFICGGSAIVTEEWTCHEGEEDSYTFPVNPSHFFFESAGNDPRHWDTSLIGEIRDYTLGELSSVLAESEYDFHQLEEIYRPFMQRVVWNSTQQTDILKEESFDTPPAQTPCRTYRVWTLENKPRYRCVDVMDIDNPVYRIEVNQLPIVEQMNMERLATGRAQGMPDEEIPLIEYRYIVDQYWHFQMLTPDGRVLTEYDTPYEHKSHPYTYKLHNYVNGDVIPFISVVIDQQRYINRLITLHDLAINASVKGIKMIPKDCVPQDMTNREFAEQFVEIGGFIFYEPSRSGHAPEVITSNSTNIGTSELLQLELNSINDITSVSQSLQGKTPSSGTPASRYAMETQNSTTAISSLITKFTSFENGVARKKMKTIHQYYTSPRNISVEHSSGYSQYGTYEPSEVRDIDFKVSIKESAESPVARMMLNDLVMELWKAGQINAEQLLSYSYYPGSEGLLQALRSAREAAEQGEGLQQIPQDQIQGATANANPQTVQQIQRALMAA